MITIRRINMWGLVIQLFLDLITFLGQDKNKGTIILFILTVSLSIGMSYFFWDF
jgi:hypothetical protein